MRTRVTKRSDLRQYGLLDLGICEFKERLSLHNTSIIDENIDFTNFSFDLVRNLNKKKD